MSPTRLDFALIQPLVYPLETWLDLRGELPELLREGAPARRGLDGARLHLVGEDRPLFDRTLDGAGSLAAAFPVLLGQVRDQPCLALPVSEPASELEAARDEWPEGLALDGAETRLLITASGEITLLHFLSARLDAARFGGTDPVLQLEVRDRCLAAIERGRSTLHETLEESIERVMRERPRVRVADAIQPDGGHLVTIARSASSAVVRALARVHEIQEGTGGNQRDLLYPARPDEPCYLHLGWAYSTAALADRGLGYRLLFPVVAVNLAWYRYRKLRSDIIDISRAIHAIETDRELIERTRFYNRAVLDVKIWEAERETFERGLRPVYRSVYDTLWDYWDTDESRETVHEGIDYVRDFLDRKYSVKIALRENTQSKILFVIAIFQLLSVFGLISGYLYFWEQTRLPEAAIFESEVMVWATIVSPIIVLVLIAWLLVSFFRRHR